MVGKNSRSEISKKKNQTSASMALSIIELGGFNCKAINT